MQSEYYVLMQYISIAPHGAGRGCLLCM